ncbi:MAG: MepB family protein [Parachlamydiaceae bacterium]|nr:MepB family protein [Parachlamydiaceae bacterium]
MTLKNSSLPLSIPSDLVTAIGLAYEPKGLLCKNFVKEEESQDYSAYVFEMNHLRIKYRTGKITPTKIGQFVTLWKRIGDGDILPHDLSDPIDLFIVSVRDGEHFGQFVFPKHILFEKGVVSKDGKGGKRAIRIYPPWDTTESRQAKAQSHFFRINAV